MPEKRWPPLFANLFMLGAALLAWALVILVALVIVAFLTGRI